MADRPDRSAHQKGQGNDVNVLDLSTLKEMGIDVTYAVNRGLLVKKGTPPDVVSKLASACAGAAKEPAFAEAMGKQGTLVNFLGARDYADFLRKNDAINRDLAKDLGMLKR